MSKTIAPFATKKYSVLITTHYLDFDNSFVNNVAANAFVSDAIPHRVDPVIGWPVARFASPYPFAIKVVFPDTTAMLMPTISRHVMIFLANVSIFRSMSSVKLGGVVAAATTRQTRRRETNRSCERPRIGVEPAAIFVL